MSVQRKFWLILIGLVLLAGCQAADEQAAGETPSAVEAAITPYLTSTPFQTIAPTATPAPTFTSVPLPTPTPYLYTIVTADTMIGIASNFGVSLDELTIANPGVNPNFLSVGDQLVIPLSTGEGDEPAAAAADILLLTTGEITCHSNPLGGMWCLWPVSNSTDQPAENLAGIIRLFDNEGEVVQSQTVFSLVNVLLPGQQIALTAYFPPPALVWESVQGQLSSAVAANQYQERYAAAEIINFNVTYLDDAKLGALVSGNIQVPVPEGGSLPVDLWVVGMAQDEAGEIVGVRRWAASPDQIAGQVGFSFQLTSLGGPIDQVSLLVEARTAAP